MRDDNGKFVNEGKKSMINELNKKICEVVEDYDSQVKKCIYSKIVEVHTLPDGTKVKIFHEKYQCFNPNFIKETILAYMSKHLKVLKNVMKILKKICSKM